MKNNSITAISGAALMLCAAPAMASSDSAGTAVAIAIPVVAGGVTLLHDWDWKGAEQLVLDTGLTVGTALILKQIVKEQRPDHSDYQSFPSDTAALAFAPAAFLWDRYGWEYGAPAYVAASYVAYSRVDAQKHHWYDVVASAGIAWGYSRIFTSEYRNPNFDSDISASPGGAFVHFNYRF